MSKLKLPERKPSVNLETQTLSGRKLTTTDSEANNPDAIAIRIMYAAENSSTFSGEIKNSNMGYVNSVEETISKTAGCFMPPAEKLTVISSADVEIFIFDKRIYCA